MKNKVMKRTLLLASAIFMLGGAVAQGKTAVVRQDSPTIEAPVSNSPRALSAACPVSGASRQAAINRKHHLFIADNLGR